jgi:hypothetical protein
MRMRVRATILTLLFCFGWTLAGRSQTPKKPIQNIDQALAAVPLPKLSAPEALEIANKFRHSRTPSDGSAIVAIDWCKSSDFWPHYIDGTTWEGLNSGGYAWFVTYIEPPSGPAKTRSVSIIRVTDDGVADFVPGVRT